MNTNGHDCDPTPADRLRHLFAWGTVTLHGVADRLGDIALEGRPINEDDLDPLYGQLYHLWIHLYAAAESCLDDVGWPPPHGDESQRWLGTYDDGTPVATLQFEPAADKVYEGPGILAYCGDLPWMPETTWGEHPAHPWADRPAGWKVVIADPPSQRQVRQRASSPSGVERQQASSPRSDTPQDALGGRSDASTHDDGQAEQMADDAPNASSATALEDRQGG